MAAPGNGPGRPQSLAFRDELPRLACCRDVTLVLPEGLVPGARSAIYIWRIMLYVRQQSRPALVPEHAACRRLRPL